MTEQLQDGTYDVAEVEFGSAQRLIFFSDAVVAIAITLLALGLSVPPIPANASEREILRLLWAQPQRLDYLAFVISFIVIGSHWRSHHRLFRYLCRVDQRVVSLNMAWLLMIVIIPFATRLLSGTNGFGVRFGFYALIQVFALLIFVLMSRHIRSHDLLRPGAPPPGPQDSDAALLAVAAMFAISIPVAFVTQWAFLCWVFSSFAARAVSRRYARDL